MSRQIPEPIRAYVGLAATVLDEARKLPETLPGLPVRVVGLAMQTALKVQQQWAGLVARGDEALTGLRGENEPGLATFDDDVDDAPAPSARASAFDRAAVDVPDHDDLAVEDTAAALDETDAVAPPVLVDDEVSGLAAVPDPAEVAETLQDITDQVAALDEAAALADAAAVLTAEDALESALLENDGAGETAEAPADTELPTADVEVTEVDVLGPDGDVETVAATITDEAIAAPETPADLEPAAAADTPAPDAAPDAEAVPEPGSTDDGGAAPTDEPQGGGDLPGSQAAGSAPISGYDGWTVAQLRGRLRGYQLSTVTDLLAYEESTRAREPFVRMLRNRLEKLERQAVDASPLAPRGM
ncbi:lipid droplet-associated protein [Trujillonella endophytica]|uniref:Lipid droplet-associated protein n=1 Tax=Trujillonella endophytica TaxID=673521 RepID=A0A1H8SGN8_9ACTN|nr:lipid droplet-associated protein [Trujillella endophytica]SEO77831.1 hypothetical protein SAMN05660991_01701 [Trujillella endophytica]